MAVEPRQNLEFSALVLFLMLLILIFGPGRLSLDHYLSTAKPVKCIRSPRPERGCGQSWWRTPLVVALSKSLATGEPRPF